LRTPRRFTAFAIRRAGARLRPGLGGRFGDFRAFVDFGARRGFFFALFFFVFTP
jgi:hypothetical protein